MDLIEKANYLYDLKIKSGQYNHYPEEALELLWQDCLTQVANMNIINSSSNERSNHGRGKEIRV